MLSLASAVRSPSVLHSHPLLWGGTGVWGTQSVQVADPAENELL